MDKEIISIKVENELDIVLAYKRAMQLSDLCGMAMANQTKFATAVSEICRNVLEYVGLGKIQFNLLEANGRLFLEGLVTDRGRGIPNLESHLQDQHKPQGTKGWGIYNSRKLVEDFFIQSDSEKGTMVYLRKPLPPNHPNITKATIQGWIEQFNNDESISPYAEIKNQNMQLIQLLDELQVKNKEAEFQLEEIKRLNRRLQASNQEISGLLEERSLTNERLIQINQELDRFAHIVSHDLKAPLFNIFSLTTIIAECLEENNQAEIQTTNRMIKDQADRMDKFINDVLLYSTTGRQNLPKVKVDVNELLQGLLASLIIPPQLKIALHPGMPTLLTEHIYLHQIFSNLIGNAIKFLNKADSRIEIGCKTEPNLLQFWVADNGAGIPLADQESIFLPYETGSLHRNTSTGLGLSIVDKIIHLKGTAVWVESKGSGGATFNFTWPVEEIVPGK
jgi:signal transduction histidine kinase/anti-sigma regulatory factor (Ser/Thr protein kinase)